MLLLRLALAFALLVGGLLAAGIAHARAEDTARATAETVADGVSDDAVSTARTVLAGLGGAAAMVQPDGSVEPDVFRTFRRDVSTVSPLETLGYVPIVESDERAAFEERTGRPIIGLDGSSFVVAPPRDVYWPVQFIDPEDPLTSPLVGFDIAATPLTTEPAAGSVDTGEAMLTEPVALSPDLTAFFIIKALYRPGQPTESLGSRRTAHVGFVVSAFAGEAIGEGATGDAPNGVRYSISDGTTELAASADRVAADAPTRRVEIGGRTWTVRVEDTRSVDHRLTVLLLGVTLVLVVALLFLARRSARYEQAVARTARLVGSTADMAQRLAGCADTDEVAATIESSVGPLFGSTGSLVPVSELPADGVGRPDEIDRAIRTREVVEWSHGRRVGAALPLESRDGEVAAVIVIERATGTRFDDVDLAAMRTVAELCEQTMSRAAVTDLASSRAEQLAQLAEALTGSSTVADVAAQVTDLARQPVGASAASIGTIDRRAGVLRVNHGADVGQDVRSRYPNPPLDTRLAFTDAARTGEAVFIADQQEYRRLYPDSDPSVASLGAGARAALPLRVGDDVIGAIVFAWDSPQSFDEALTSDLTTLAKMATQAVLRARLTEEQIEEARRSRELADFAQRVAEVRMVEELVDAVIEHGGRSVNSVVSNLGLVDETAERLEVRPHPRFNVRDVEGFGQRLLDDDLPALTAIRTGRTVLMETAEEIATRYPGRFSDAAAATGIRSTAHLVLMGADARPIGAIGFGWDAPRQFTATTVSTLETLAELCAQTLERLRLTEAEHDLVDSLQRQVVRPLAVTPGLAVAQRYRPAAHAVGMCGDWYEGITLVDGRYAVVVGDIAGHGITAVSDMIQLRAIVGALLRTGVSPGDVFAQASGLLDDDRPVVTATAGIVIIEPATESLSYVMAGHPPPAVISPDGEVTFLDGGRQPLLGLPIVPVTPGVDAFPPGSTLLAYTDGLIERRTESIDESLERLLDVLRSSAQASVQDLADEVMRRCLGDGDPNDDVALVVVRSEPQR